MNFLHLWGFDVKQGKTREFQQWLSANEEKLALECPEGTKYLGTYACVETSEKTAGSFRSVFQLERYGTMDNFSAAMKEGGTFAVLMGEFTEFMDQDRHANWSSALCRKVTDAAIWGE
jgi:hypothetical protein